MKDMRPEFVRGASLLGYGVSLSLGIGIPIPILDQDVLRRTTVRDRDIYAPVVDYSTDYPQRTGNILGKVSYQDCRRGEITVRGKKVETGSLASYMKAREVAHLLADEIRRGDFLVQKAAARLPLEGRMKTLEIRNGRSQ
jgi:uncharacterized protein (DUF39 family)